MNKKKTKQLKSGQAMLIAILMIFVASIAIGIAADTVALTQTNVIQNQKISNETYNLAASCIENTLMRMTRADFTAAQDLTLSSPNSKCIISINTVGGQPAPTYEVLSTAEIPATFFGGKKVTRKIQATVVINNGVTTVTSFGEVY